MGNGLVYQPPDCSYYCREYEGELLWVPRDEDEPTNLGIPCLLLQSPAASSLMIYFHANAEDLGQIYLLLRYFRTFLGVHVLAVEYPGYGLSSGEPSERQVLDDAVSVLDFAVNELEVPFEQILVVGRSLGGCPAIHLASSFQGLGGLVTLSTFSSAASFVAAGEMGRSLLGMVIGYDNISRIRGVTCPTLILHGEDDAAIDQQHAHDLGDECGADWEGDKDYVDVQIRKGMSHNNFETKQDIIEPIKVHFPQLCEGEPLELPQVDEYLRDIPRRLAPDVIERLPYEPERMEKSHMLPFVKTKVISKDGEEI